MNFCKLYSAFSVSFVSAAASGTEAEEVWVSAGVETDSIFEAAVPAVVFSVVSAAG